MNLRESLSETDNSVQLYKTHIIAYVKRAISVLHFQRLICNLSPNCWNPFIQIPRHSRGGRTWGMAGIRFLSLLLYVSQLISAV